MKRLTAPAAAAACLMSWAATAPGQPSLSHSSPAAVRPGVTVELTLHGEALRDPLRVWTSFPADVQLAPVSGDADKVKSRSCKITPDDDVPVGLGGIVVASPAGASDIHFVLIDDLAGVTDNGDNHSADQAQPIELPVAIDGVADGSQSDRYRFKGTKNQRVSVDVFAARLGTPLDPVVRLIGPDGREVRLADDDPSLGADARFSCRLPEGGEYRLTIHDNRYRSGGRYRLRIGDIPLVSATYPMGIRRGSTRRITFVGPAAEDVAEPILHVPADHAQRRYPLSGRRPGGEAAAPATIVVSQLPEITHREPDPTPAAANRVTVPVALNGRLKRDGDQDHFEFAAAKGQTLSFRSFSRSLGSPAVVFMRLLDDENRQLATSPADNPDEWSFDHKFAEKGIYRVAIEDLGRRGGPEYVYRIEIHPSLGFDLAVKPDQNTRFHPPARQGAFVVSLQCNRRGYDGPVRLSLQPPTGDFELLNPTVPPGAKEHALVVAIAGNPEPGSVRPLRIVGRATRNRQSRAVVASNLAKRRANRPQMIYPPEWSDGLIFAAVGPRSEPFYAVEPSATEVRFERSGGRAEFTLQLHRNDPKFEASPTVTILNIPSGLKSEIEAPEKATAIEVALVGPKDVASGEHPLRVITHGELEGRRIATVHEVMLRIPDSQAGDGEESPDGQEATKVQGEQERGATQ